MIIKTIAVLLTIIIVAGVIFGNIIKKIYEGMTDIS